MKEISELKLHRPDISEILLKGKVWLRNIPFAITRGRMNQDGTILPCNEPVLVYKRNIVTTHTSVLPVLVAQLNEEVGVPLNEAQYYYFDVYPYIMEDSVGSATDELIYELDNAGGTDIIQNANVADIGSVANTRDRIGPFRFFPDATHATLNVRAPNWTTGTEKWQTVIMGYRMPYAVCKE